MKTRVRHKQNADTDNYIETKIYSYFNVLSKFIVAWIVMQAVFISTIIISHYLGNIVAILLFPIELYYIYKTRRFFIKYKHLIYNLPKFKKRILRPNQKVNISAEQMYNHYNYFPQSYIESRYTTYQYLENFKKVVLLSIIMTIINFFIWWWEWYSLWTTIKISIWIIVLGIILYIYTLVRKIYIQPAKKTFEHYMLKMEPTHYSLQENNIFFY
jgi:hypothetical protein